MDYFSLTIALLSLATIWHFHREFRSLRKQLSEERCANAVVRQNCRRLEDLMLSAERRLEEAEEKSAKLVPPPASRSGLNITKRAQAARMFRRGDHPGQIAAVLGLPRSEVDLLLKIQKTTLAG
jgi:hypothetical protein